MKINILVICILFVGICGCSEDADLHVVSEVETVVTAEDMEAEAKKYLNTEDPNNYWDFSDPKIPTAEEVLNGPKSEKD